MKRQRIAEKEAEEKVIECLNATQEQLARISWQIMNIRPKQAQFVPLLPKPNGEE